MMTLERRHKSITVLKPYFLPKRLHSTKGYFIKTIDHTFNGFTGVITHLGCWENTQKACKSLAFGSWFTSFSRVLPTSRVGYHSGKPIESVVYCLNIYIVYISGFSLSLALKQSLEATWTWPICGSPLSLFHTLLFEGVLSVHVLWTPICRLVIFKWNRTW